MVKKSLDMKKLNQIFNKQQILTAKKYKDRTDLLNAILQDSKDYSLKEVDTLIEKFLKGKVK